MKYGIREISDLDDWTLLGAYDKCGQAERLRKKANAHEKFNDDKKKMEFPPINPEFIKMKNEIEKELKKRNLI